MEAPTTSPRTRSRVAKSKLTQTKLSPRSPRAVLNSNPQPVPADSKADHHRHHSFGGYTVSSKPQNVSPATEAAAPARIERRASSFASPSSPWARRRSFLSNTMLHSEKHLVYELASARLYALDPSTVPTYSISLRESQGFAWNQDLFASQAQQQSGVVYDDGDSDDEAITDSDEEDADYLNDGLRRRAGSSRRAFSYSLSNTEGVVQKVKVIDLSLDDDDDDDDIFGFDEKKEDQK